MLDYEHFVATVEREAEAPRQEAEHAVQATLQTLAERLSGGEAEHIARQLSPELRPLLQDGGNAQPFDLQEFVRRIAQREGVDRETAERHARAVFATLGRAVSHDEITDMASELPKDFGPLIAEAESAPPTIEPPVGGQMRLEDFLEHVARRSGLQPHQALRATGAVLEALAERISGGEVDDLAARLPGALDPPLRRGNARSNGAAPPFSLDEFLQRIAEREGVTPAEARQHARAVMATVREAVGEDEFADVEAQLPKDYAVLRQ